MNSRAFFLSFLLATQAFAADTPAPAPPPKPAPVIDPANALTGRALIDALRGGGYVLYMRHAKYARITPECNQVNLAPEGEEAAKKIGVALHEHKIPIGSVRASTQCRAIETAKLLEEGPVEATPDLNPSEPKDAALHAARMKLLAETPKRGTNTILVSHVQNSDDRSVQLTLVLCEIIAFKPDGKGGAVAVARIGPDDWAALPK